MKTDVSLSNFRDVSAGICGWFTTLSDNFNVNKYDSFEIRLMKIMMIKFNFATLLQLQLSDSEENIKTTRCSTNESLFM